MEIVDLFIAVFLLILIILISVRLIVQIASFKYELTYLNMEIRRTTGSERKYWQKEKRRLWLSFIPFYKR